MQLELNNLRKTYLLPAPLLHRRGQGKPKTKQALAGVSLTLGPGLYLSLIHIYQFDDRAYPCAAPTEQRPPGQPQKHPDAGTAGTGV